MPVLLRAEPFGGILFRPRDAVHVELDQEAFAFMRDHLFQGRQPGTPDETRLLEHVRAEIGPDDLSVRARLIEYERLVEPRDFPVYNAPTLADFQITTQCPVGCPHCYASSNPDGVRVGLDDIQHVFGQLRKNGVTQVAIGGGEPLSHPDFIQVLESCFSHGLLPNLTTNGLFFDSGKLDAMKRYCGAVALSLEGVGPKFEAIRRTGWNFFQSCLVQLLDRGFATVLQVTLSRENFADLDDIVDFCLQHPRLYGVIFLAYKEVGRGMGFQHVLSGLQPDQVHEKLRDAFLRLVRRMRVGYDCCLTPAIVGLEPDLGFAQTDQLEGCSAMRSSMGILPNLDVAPCTFTPGMVMGNLKRENLSELWRGPAARAFRDSVQHRIQTDKACGSCHARLDCLGGCPVFDLVRCVARR